jgi:hypothetical protein
MRNLYSETKGQAAIRALFRTAHDRTGNLPTFRGIFPDQLAPIVRNSADGERELVIAHGHAYICVRENPGVPSQSSHWMLLASRGAAGPRGHRGERGRKGERGDPAQAIARWEISREKFTIVPFYQSGGSAPPTYLRKFFETYRDMTSG